MKNEHSIQGEMASSELPTQIGKSKQLYMKAFVNDNFDGFLPGLYFH